MSRMIKTRQAAMKPRFKVGDRVVVSGKIVSVGPSWAYVEPYFEQDNICVGFENLRKERKKK